MPSSDREKYNPIEEYFKDTGKNVEKEHIFTGDDADIDLKTELNDKEISHISIMTFNDQFLKRQGIKPIYTPYINNFMRKKVSKNRQSRKEYVDIKKTEVQEPVEETRKRLGL